MLSSEKSDTHRFLCYSVTLTIRKIEQTLLEAGHHVCILTTRSGNSKNTNMDGQHPNRSVIFIEDAIPLAHTIDLHNNDNTYYIGFSLSSAVRAKIEAFEPSLVHITVPDMTCLHLIDYARRKELPLMGTYHSNIPEYLDHYPGLGWLKYLVEAFFRHQYNFLQSLYVPTPFIQKQLTNTLKMDAITNLGVWGRGIDLDRFSPKHRSQIYRQKFGFTDDDVVLLWVGRLVPEKRPDIFIEVIRRLHARRIPFKALVVGAGPSEDAVKALPNTTFAGWMNGDELATAYASSDVFLFPSAVETFGNVTLEAAASGLPIVVEEGCGGHLVRHGLSGFACDQYDVDAFFNSVLCLVLDDERRKKMANEGRKLSMNFEKRTVCKRMLDNYASVTNEFYCEYGGHHANRDAVYEKEHSFTSGNTPRPLLLVFVEYLFIVLFAIMYRLTVVFMYLRENMVFVVPNTSADVPPQRQENRVVVVHTTNDNSFEGSRNVSLSSIGEDMDYSVDSERPDMLLSTVKEDDDTDSTSSLSTETPSNSRSSDLHPVHKVTIILTKVLQFSVKAESTFRNRASALYSRSDWKGMKRRRKERKNTGDGMEDYCQLKESFASMPNLAREERLSLRRSNSSAIFA
jgi:glycosyltransferase involved in cell wall biosynthesis